MARWKFDRLFRICGAAGLTGCAALILTDIAGALVLQSYDPVAQSISSLAAGRYGWIQDIGLYLAAIGVFACAVGLLRLRPNGASWIFGGILLMLIAPDLALIASVNEYAGAHNPGAHVHKWASYALGILIAMVAFLQVPGLKSLNAALGRSSLWFGILWVVAAPSLLAVPTGWDGAYERFLAILAIAALATASWLLIRQGHS